MGCARRSGPRNCRSSKAAPRGQFPSADELLELGVRHAHGAEGCLHDGLAGVAAARLGRVQVEVVDRLLDGGLEVVDRLHHVGLRDRVDGRRESLLGILELQLEPLLVGREVVDLLREIGELDRRASGVDLDFTRVAGHQQAAQEVLHTFRQAGGRDQSLDCVIGRDGAGASGSGRGVGAGREGREGRRVGDQRDDLLERGSLLAVREGGAVRDILHGGGDLVAQLAQGLDVLGLAGGRVEAQGCHGVLLGTSCGREVDIKLYIQLFRTMSLARRHCALLYAIASSKVVHSVDTK